MAETSLETVNRFCAAWSRRNIDELIEFFTEDADTDHVHEILRGFGIEG